MKELIQEGDYLRNDRTGREYVVLAAIEKGGTLTLEERDGEKIAVDNNDGYTQVTVRPIGGGEIEMWRLK